MIDSAAAPCRVRTCSAGVRRSVGPTRSSTATASRCRTWGSIALSHCATAHLLHTGFPNRFGASFSEVTKRPSPSTTSAGATGVAIWRRASSRVPPMVARVLTLEHRPASLHAISWWVQSAFSEAALGWR
jgi:hypothetical protein